jgi:hypothetical protein
MPAQAGIHVPLADGEDVDPRFRGGDGEEARGDDEAGGGDEEGTGVTTKRRG